MQFFFIYLHALVGIISRATRCDIIKVPASTKPMSRTLIWGKGKKLTCNTVHALWPRFYFSMSIDRIPQHVISIILSIQKSCSNSLCTQSLSHAHMQVNKEELHSRDSPSLHMVGQLPSQYLASRRLGYGVDEEHLADLLVRGHPLCDVVYDLSLRDLATRLPDHKRHRYLPCLLMRIPVNKFSETIRRYI